MHVRVSGGAQDTAGVEGQQADHRAQGRRGPEGGGREPQSLPEDTHVHGRPRQMVLVETGLCSSGGACQRTR